MPVYPGVNAAHEIDVLTIDVSAANEVILGAQLRGCGRRTMVTDGANLRRRFGPDDVCKELARLFVGQERVLRAQTIPVVSSSYLSIVIHRMAGTGHCTCSIVEELEIGPKRCAGKRNVADDH